MIRRNSVSMSGINSDDNLSAQGFGNCLVLTVSPEVLRPLVSSKPIELEAQVAEVHKRQT